jgi:hypothetical protein
MTGRASTSPTSDNATSRRRFKIWVRAVFTNPSEKINQLGRRSVTSIFPVSFS